MRIAMTLLALSLSLAGCKKKSEDETPPTPPVGSGSDMGSGSAMVGSGSATAGSGSAMAGSGSGSDAGSGSATVNAGSGSGSSGGGEVAMQHHAGMCPSTVFGSTTKAALKDGKVLVTVTSNDKDAIAAIQKRTDESLKDKVENSNLGNAGSAHDQKGTHGGGVGLCPVHVPEGATATAKQEAKGVIVTIALKDPKGAEALKTEIDGRIAKAADWVKANITPGDSKNQGGDGGGKGPHGSNHTGKGDGSGKKKK